jgi:hypothetical protein
MLLCFIIITILNCFCSLGSYLTQNTICSIKYSTLKSFHASARIWQRTRSDSLTYMKGIIHMNNFFAFIWHPYLWFVYCRCDSAASNSREIITSWKGRLSYFRYQPGTLQKSLRKTTKNPLADIWTLHFTDTKHKDRDALWERHRTVDLSKYFACSILLCRFQWQDSAFVLPYLQFQHKSVCGADLSKWRIFL